MYEEITEILVYENGKDIPTQEVSHDDFNAVEAFLSHLTNCTPKDARHALAVLERLGELGSEAIRLRAEIADLGSQDRCCGHEWRNKAGRLYMHHSLRDDCPMHGRVNNGADRGLRIYIRAEDETDALEALARYETWKSTEADLRRAESSQSTLSRRLSNYSGGYW